jgi:hypothetical protein
MLLSNAASKSRRMAAAMAGSSAIACANESLIRVAGTDSSPSRALTR